MQMEKKQAAADTSIEAVCRSLSDMEQVVSKIPLAASTYEPCSTGGGAFGFEKSEKVEVRPSRHCLCKLYFNKG